MFSDLLLPLLALLLAPVLYWWYRYRRLHQSLAAAQGNEDSLHMERTRLKARGLGTLSFVAAGLTGLLCLYLEFSSEVSFVYACIVYVIFSFWAHTLQQRYAADFKAHFVTAELAKVFDDLRYEPEGIFGQETIAGLHLFKAVNKVKGNDYISAHYKGIALEQGDICLEEEYSVTVQDEHGNSHTEEQIEVRFRGRAMRFDLDAAFRGPVQVVRRDFSEARVLTSPGDWQRVETELAAFGESFEVFARDPLDAMSVMTPQMIEAIHYLDQKLNVPLAFHFEGRSIYVFMALSRDAFDVSGKKTLLEERELLQEDMALITGFLNTMYFRGRKISSPEQGAEPTREGAGGMAVTAATVGAVSAPFFMRRITMGLQGPFRLLCGLVFWLPLSLWLLSVVIALAALPDDVFLSFSISEDMVSREDNYTTLGYLLVGAVFILPSVLLAGGTLQDGLRAFLLGGGSGKSRSTRITALLKSLLWAFLQSIPLWLHIGILYLNLAVR